MERKGGKIDLTDPQKADKNLSDLKDKAGNKSEIIRSIEEKQKYINKPICKDKKGS